MATTFKQSWIKATENQLKDVMLQKAPLDWCDYMTALISVAIGEAVCKPRAGFIAFVHNDNKFVYPHIWIEVPGHGIIDISVFKKSDPASNIWFVKPGIILDKPYYFADVLPEVKAEKVVEMQRAQSDRIYLTKPPIYLKDQKSIEYFLHTAHVIEELDFDIMCLPVTSVQKRKMCIRQNGEKAYKLFLRACALTS